MNVPEVTLMPFGLAVDMPLPHVTVPDAPPKVAACALFTFGQATAEPLVAADCQFVVVRSHVPLPPPAEPLAPMPFQK